MLVAPSVTLVMRGFPSESIVTVTFPASISPALPEKVAEVMPGWEIENLNQLPTL